MTKDANNRVPVKMPAAYNREDFVGVLDALASGQIDKVFGYPSRCIFKAQLPPLPNGKYDINDVSRSVVRLSLPGKNLEWPNGDKAARKKIFDEHIRDQVGLLYFLQHDEAVPERFRSEALQWGWCRDEFTESEHLPPQLYVREARRMVGRYVYSQRDSEHAPGDARAVLHMDSIAMGDYGNNCHGTFHEGPRFGGKHTGEFYNAVPPYQIPYGVLVPRELDNLLVSGAVSSTHVGFCGLRLEPIWMALGQAAGHAAAHSVTYQQAVQDVSVASIQARLHEVGSATIYTSDVLPGHAAHNAIQWWGTIGGLHGLEPMPGNPGQRGKNLHGQYFEANPGHEVKPRETVSPELYKRWKVVAVLAGCPVDQVVEYRDDLTREEFIQSAFAIAHAPANAPSTNARPRMNPMALANTHPPGEVDNVELVQQVVLAADSLPGVTVDDCDAILVGDWQYSTHTPPYVGRGYLHDQNSGKGQKTARFVPTLPGPGLYEVRLSHCTNIRRAPQVPITIRHAGKTDETIVNEQQMPEHSQLFTTLGRFQFDASGDEWVEISNRNTNGKYVIADAIQFLPVAK